MPKDEFDVQLLGDLLPSIIEVFYFCPLWGLFEHFDPAVQGKLDELYKVKGLCLDLVPVIVGKYFGSDI